MRYLLCYSELHSINDADLIATSVLWVQVEPRNFYIIKSRHKVEGGDPTASHQPCTKCYILLQIFQINFTYNQFNEGSLDDLNRPLRVPSADAETNSINLVVEAPRI